MEFFQNKIREEIEWGGRTLSLETGKVARQADGAVIAQYGDTIVLCTAVVAGSAGENVDFLPLSVHYQEKAFAAGRIPGGFFKREGKPSEKEVLTSRLIDRPIRPLFTKYFTHELQIICTVLSHDLENNPDIVALIGASAALSLSGAPFLGPVGGVRIGYLDGGYVVNPSQTQQKECQLDLIVAGTGTGVLMVESEANELSEEVMLGAVKHGFEAFQPVIRMIESLKARAGKKPMAMIAKDEILNATTKRIQDIIGSDLRQAYGLADKKERYAAVHAVKTKAKEALAADVADDVIFSMAFQSAEATILRQDILNNKRRIDGRDLTTVRPIMAEVGILPRSHGSSLFTRGETQALVVTTLGTGQDEQIIDALAGEYRERFMLHYNFPPYSVNEIGRMSSPGRREIGHGKLAWRAIHPLLPSKEDFAYTIRTVSEVTESNGSSSMATVCGTSLSMMDAGVPLIRPVAGIAMGLIKEGEQFAVLSDIIGDEDHLGDMDFKVAGTELGITALQMDIKITSITHGIMEVALQQAKEGRLHILGKMAEALDISRSGVSEYAPRISILKIPRDRIRDIIGPGGKIIREICETTGAKIDIDDDGTIKVASVDAKGIEAAIEAIKAIACEPEVGTIYTGKVVKVMDFGAFVNFMGNRDGLVHISELSEKRVNKVEEIVKVGDVVQVKVVGFDDRGKVKLTMKGLSAGH